MHSIIGPHRPARALGRLVLNVCAALGCALAMGAATAGVNVSAGGQASYGLPIAVPPGIAGMAPNLSLSYVDGGINGPLGVGWSVQGISAITRCPASRVVDGAAKSVAFDGSDKLCLDGQRLIQFDPVTNLPSTSQVNDALGLAGNCAPTSATVYREYRTEKDMFARIRAYGTSGAVAGNGPACFKVWTKSGQVYEYGNVDAAAIDKATVYAMGRTAVAVWAVRRISDVVGNFMDFKYHLLDTAWGSGTTAAGAVGREWGIAEIQYTGNGTGAATQQPSNKVVFSYEVKPVGSTVGFDNAEAYQLDSKNVSTYRINAIRAYVNSPNPGTLDASPGAVMVRAYKLSYEASLATGRSRLTSVLECVGPANQETVCLPAVSMTYSGANAPTFTAHTGFGASPMRNLPMTEPVYGEYGILTGDFDGDGRTDILRWSRTTSYNELWLSNGDGTFTKSSSFNLTDKNLNGSNPSLLDECYVGIVGDFNGDGLSDILRTAKPSCSADGNLLFLSNGNGSFTTVALPAGMDLQQLLAKKSTVSAPCILPYAPVSGSPTKGGGAPPSSAVVPPSDNFGPGAGGLTAGGASAKTSPKPDLQPLAGTCYTYSRTLGKRFYVLDVNADGIPDIVTTVAVGYSQNSNWGAIPSEDELCANSSSPCSRVWLGSLSGTFTEQTTTNIVNTSVYSDPPNPKDKSNPYWRLPNQADINGDGLQDILAKYTGRWRSTGDGNFTGSPVHDTSQLCGLPIDFNGDGRSDCLFPDATAANQTMTLSYGAATSAPVAQFNVTTPADNLYAVNSNSVTTVGVLTEDFNGDGRQDILRWGQTPADNGIYISKGDGSFWPRVPAGLDAISRPLQSADGTTTIALGDFLGNGSLQFLHLKGNPGVSGDTVALTNQLYSSSAGPVDVLASVKTSTGLVSTVGPRVPLTNSGGSYVNDRGTTLAAVYPLLDIQAPIYVISSVTNDTGTPTPLVTNYLYKGLKADRLGRGLLGFREVQQQNPAPGGYLTTATEFVMQHPYLGVAARSTTRSGTLGQGGAPVLSTTINTYCDTNSATAPTSASSAAPCTARPVNEARPYLYRPYLYTTVETGTDPAGNALPTITSVNTFNNWGDPLTLKVSTMGSFLGQNRTYTKTTTNTFCLPDTANCPNKVAAENWILGRLTGSSVRNQVPNILPSFTPSPGTSSNAQAVTGPGVAQ